MQRLLTIAKGNPGAIRVLAELSTKMAISEIVEVLTKHNIDGSLVWLSYKDLLNGDIDKLRVFIQEDRLMFEIQERCKIDKSFKEQWDYHVQAENRR
jgi:hypothetical protein